MRSLPVALFAVVLLAGCASKDGKDGAAGATGPIGPTGATGVVGPTGPVGPPGPIGPTGATGPLGATGAMGAPGAAGAAGTSGTPGAAGAQGPSGVLSVVSVPSASGTWAASGTANAFFGGFATVTLTGNQRVTGVVSAVAGTAALGLTATCSFALCHRPSGSTAAPTRFDQGRFIYLSDVGRAFTGSETVILPAGTWDIGLCGYVLEPNQVNGTSVGWVMVTN